MVLGSEPRFTTGLHQIAGHHLLVGAPPVLLGPSALQMALFEAWRLYLPSREDRLFCMVSIRPVNTGAALGVVAASLRLEAPC